MMGKEGNSLIVSYTNKKLDIKIVSNLETIYLVFCILYAKNNNV